MAYGPPAANAVNFDFAGAYGPPASNGVNPNFGVDGPGSGGGGGAAKRRKPVMGAN